MNTDGLAEFLAVAQAGTFTAAAKTLGVSVPHVSRQVQRLEQRLGTKLFNRNTRSVRLTATGESLRNDSQTIADDVERALQNVSSANQRLQGRLRIASVSGSFADNVVAPAIVNLAEQNPDLDIEIDFNARKVDILREGYDLAVRSGPMDDSELVARPLASRTYVAVGARDYLNKRGTPEHPRDLVNHTCIQTHSSPWRFNDHGQMLKVTTTGPLRFNSSAGIIDACSRGLGIAYMVSAGYGDALKGGTLMPVLKKFWASEKSVHIVRADRKFVPRRVELAIKFLQAAAKIEEARELAQIENLRT